MSNLTQTRRGVKTKVNLKAIGDVAAGRNRRGNQKFDEAHKEIFLEELRKTGNITIAAANAGVTYQTVINHRKMYPEFAAAEAQAIEEAIDYMEHEVVRRGFQGVEKDVYYKGEVVGQEVHYSDQLALRTLEAMRPEKWRSKTSVDVSGTMDVNVSETKGKLLTMLGVNLDDIEDVEIVED